MNENRIKRNRMLGETIIKGLESRNMEGYYVESKEEALKKALELIPEGSSVSWGGSMSIAEIGLKDAIRQGNYTAYDREGAKNPEEKRKMELAAYDCDFFLCSSRMLRDHRSQFFKNHVLFLLLIFMVFNSFILRQTP